VKERFDELKQRLGVINDVEKATGLLLWDEETGMPPAGGDARAEQLGTLQQLAHETWVDPALGELLEELRPFEAEHDHDSFEASLIRVTRRDYEKAVRVPPELTGELARASSLGYRIWLHAREEKDYSILLPRLEETLELRRRYIECFAPYDDPYDVLLDDFEPGTTSAEVEVIFDRLKVELVPMIAAVADRAPVDDACLRGRFPVGAQRELALRILGEWGMDAQSWRLDNTVHPFASNMSPADIRLTTNFSETSVEGILSCMHEFGHGIYERQVDPVYTRTPLASGCSYAFHESQSRMWENLVGRSVETWRHFYPLLQNEFSTFSGVPLDTFHRALNKVQPSLKRVDADEVTYCLHVVLRFELERAILSGELALRDFPEAFDEKMQEYLGLQPPDDTQGVMQDVHWSDAGFGYFPTYALGNVISVQLWERAETDLGGLAEQFERGEFAPLREWLREHVHRFGRVLEPKELLERTVGGGMDPEPYLGYLGRKLEELYGIGVRG
jgi:carboxypeptidase Taq